MPRINVNNSKGLYQNSGSGTHIGGTVNFNKFNVGAPLVSATKYDGSAVSGTTGHTNIYNFQGGKYLYGSILGAGQTIVAPVIAATGLDFRLDAADNEGISLKGAATDLALGTEGLDYFTVGTSPAFYAKVKLLTSDISKFDDVRFGFKIASQAHTATLADITDYVAICVVDVAGDIQIKASVDNTEITPVDITTGEIWANDTSLTLEVRVSASGSVTYYVNGNKLSEAPASVMNSDDKVCLWLYQLSGATGAATFIIEELECGLQDASNS